MKCVSFRLAMKDQKNVVFEKVNFKKRCSVFSKRESVIIKIDSNPNFFYLCSFKKLIEGSCAKKKDYMVFIIFHICRPEFINNCICKHSSYCIAYLETNSVRFKLHPPAVKKMQTLKLWNFRKKASLAHKNQQTK